MTYITVKEFAKRAGISKQAVYKKIKSPYFQKYVKKIGNSIMVSELALVESDKLNIESLIESNQYTVEGVKISVDSTFENGKVVVENDIENDKSNIESSKNSVENEVESSCTTCKLVETLQKENEYIKKQLEDIIQLSNKQLTQIESLYTQLKDKDKLIEQLSTQILNQTRLPVIVEQPKQNFFQKLKLKLFKK